MAKDSVAVFFNFVRQGLEETPALSPLKMLNINNGKIEAADIWALYALGKFGRDRVMIVHRNGGLPWVLGLYKTDVYDVWDFVNDTWERLVMRGDLDKNEIVNHMEQLVNEERNFKLGAKRTEGYKRDQRIHFRFPYLFLLPNRSPSNFYRLRFSRLRSIARTET